MEPSPGPQHSLRVLGGGFVPPRLSALTWGRCTEWGGDRVNTKQIGALAAAAVLVIAAIVLLRHRVPAPVVAPSAPVSAGPVAAVAPADCLLPGPPPVPPPGETASPEDMRLGHDVMQAFVVQLEAYQTCRNAQIDHAAPGVTQAQKRQWLDQGNAAIDEANALAAAFGAQLRVFKGRGSGQ